MVMRRLIVLLCFFFCFIADGQPSRQILVDLLGIMPKPPAVHVDTLQSIRLEKGFRYKIRYLAEESDPRFHTNKDFIEAWLFVPDHPSGKKIPAMIAIHQDGPHNYIGKNEPAGITGDSEQFYGLELYNRGYIVICPDRFYHGPRRRIANPDTLADLWDQGALLASEHWAGQLLVTGRCTMGKEVYDLERTTDVLFAMPEVDRNKIGAIGHSAGGNALAYFMFADQRVKIGVSSCGLFEFADWWDEKAPMKRYAFTAIPGFVNLARSSDFLGRIAPRPFLMTRGLWEWGQGDSTERRESREHVEMTRRLAAEAGKYYHALQADSSLKTIYFDENGGNHAFPPGIREKAYRWIDSYLKNK
jgi:dienelactone hydrolase